MYPYGRIHFSYMDKFQILHKVTPSLGEGWDGGISKIVEYRRKINYFRFQIYLHSKFNILHSSLFESKFRI